MNIADQDVAPSVLLCSVSEAAVRLGVSGETIRRQISNGQLKGTMGTLNGRRAYIVELPIATAVTATTTGTQIALNDALNRDILHLEAQIADIKQRHQDELDRMERQHRAIMDTMADTIRRAHTAELERLKADYAERKSATLPVNVEQQPPARRGWFDWLLGR